MITKDILVLLNDNSNHQTRSVTSLSCQIPKDSGLKAFFFNVIKCWNSLPFCVRNIDLTQSFISMFKKEYSGSDVFGKLAIMYLLLVNCFYSYAICKGL